MLPDRVHYGCGPHIIEGWLNVDMAGPHIKEENLCKTFCVDLAHRHPFPDGWFQWGYSQYFLQRLFQPEAILFLYECHRTFRVGGVLRISLPSMIGAMLHWFSNTDSRTVEHALWSGYEQWRSKCYWSEVGLQQVAEHIGFSVSFAAYGESSHHELTGIDTRSHLKKVSMFIELTKQKGGTD